jgi:hypothetical protein
VYPSMFYSDDEWLSYAFAVSALTFSL